MDYTLEDLPVLQAQLKGTKEAYSITQDPNMLKVIELMEAHIKVALLSHTQPTTQQ